MRGQGIRNRHNISNLPSLKGRTTGLVPNLHKTITRQAAEAGKGPASEPETCELCEKTMNIRTRKMRGFGGGSAILHTLALAAALVVLVGFAAPTAAEQEAADGVKSLEARIAALNRLAGIKTGHEVYAAACAGCHGTAGDGRGRGAAGFEFAATDFRAGLYKFRGTVLDALPSDEDLVRSTRQGMPGTEMVPFGRLLTPASIRAVAAYLKTLSADFSHPEKQLSEDELVALPASRPFEPSAESAAAGRELFKREECHSCHGEEGDGRGPDAEGMTDDWDRPLRMFDFAEGLFKSGATDLDLFRTITTGMNGTPMESYLDSTSEEERWQLVDFIRSLEMPRGGFFRYLFSDRPSGLDFGQ